MADLQQEQQSILSVYGRWPQAKTAWHKSLTLPAKLAFHDEIRIMTERRES